MICNAKVRHMLVTLFQSHYSRSHRFEDFHFQYTVDEYGTMNAAEIICC